nr:hypothetical protein [Tanacetum cinerariifolium]
MHLTFLQLVPRFPCNIRMPGVDWSDKVDQEMRCRDWREIRVGLNSAFNLNGDRDNIFRIYTFGPFGFIRICS